MAIFALSIIPYLESSINLFKLSTNPVLDYLSTLFGLSIGRVSPHDSEGIAGGYRGESYLGIMGNYGGIGGIFGKIGRDGDYGNFGNYGMGLEEGDYLEMGRESQRETISRVAASRGGTISGMRHSISGAVFFSSWLSSGVMKVQSTG